MQLTVKEREINKLKGMWVEEIIDLKSNYGIPFIFNWYEWYTSIDQNS